MIQISKELVSNENNWVNIATHDGLFHADEIIAIALISLWNISNNYNIIRTRDEELISKCDLVVDVGGQYNLEKSRFDHHQNDCPIHEGTDIKYASAGLVWDKVAKDIALNSYNLTAQEADKFHKMIMSNLILGIDANDNGIHNEQGYVHMYTISEVLKTFNNLSDNTQQAFNFKYCIEFVVNILKNIFSSTVQIILDEKILQNAAEKAKDGILVLPKFILSWKEFCLNHNLPIQVCLVKAGENEWSITSALKRLGSVECLCPAPINLRGTNAKDNESLNGCPIVFVHHTGFTGKVKANTLNEAIGACKAWIEGSATSVV